MNAPADDLKDPRYRPFRGALLGVYLVFTIGFSLLIIVSVYRSVLRMTPDRPPAGEVRSEAECLSDARRLFGDLEGQRKLQGLEPDVRHSDQRFLQFRVEWLKNKRAIESHCALENRENVRDAFSALDRVLDLYTTASVQFSGAVGPTVDKFKSLTGP